MEIAHEINDTVNTVYDQDLRNILVFIRLQYAFLPLGASKSYTLDL